jgi:hypothetical protein
LDSLGGGNIDGQIRFGAYFSGSSEGVVIAECEGADGTVSRSTNSCLCDCLLPSSRLMSSLRIKGLVVALATSLLTTPSFTNVLDQQIGIHAKHGTGEQKNSWHDKKKNSWHDTSTWRARVNCLFHRSSRTRACVCRAQANLLGPRGKRARSAVLAGARFSRAARLFVPTSSSA